MKKHYKVLFVSSSGKIHKLIPFIKSQFESLNPYVEKLDHFRIEGEGIKSYLKAKNKLKQILEIGNYDIVHSHWTYSGILCSLLIRNEKLVISFLGNDLQGIYSKKFNILTAKGLLNILLSQYLIFKANAVIVKSDKMLRWIPAFYRRKSHVIPNGINLNRFAFKNQAEARNYLNLDSNSKYILFLGDTNDYNKNFELLKKSVHLMEINEIHCTLLAPYPIDQELVPYYLSATNVFAFTSKLEGSPNVVKEALAVKCPIVSTDVGDVSERIHNIEGCYIADSNPYDFSRKLQAALEFNQRIDSSDQIKEISEPKIAGKIINVYEKILTSTG